MIAAAAPAPRAELFRLLGDEGRLRLLALCGEDELTITELATLLDESQPQVSKKAGALRAASLLAARRDGTRTLLTIDDDARGDPVVKDALDEGRRLCRKDGSLARVATVVAAREEHARRFFDDAPAANDTVALQQAPATAYLQALAPLLPAHRLAVDVGTGDGTFLPLLSPLYDRVIAVDRSAARLARCAARTATFALPNVRLLQGSFDDAGLFEELARLGGADLVLCARLLHHAARPQDAIGSLARLCRPGGHVVVVDYLPHVDDSMHESQADVWLGFTPERMGAWMQDAGLAVVAAFPWSGPLPAGEPDSHLPWQVAVGRKPTA